MDYLTSSNNKGLLKAALAQLAEATQNLSNVLEQTESTLSDAAPEYMNDIEDFTYEIISFVEDEITELDEEEIVDESNNTSISA